MCKEYSSFSIIPIISALFIDSAISSFTDTVSNQVVIFWGITLFIIIAAVFGLGQYFILELVKTKKQKKSSQATQ
jgi:tellurite resistance protein TehA-like permease